MQSLDRKAADLKYPVDNGRSNRYSTIVKINGYTPRIQTKNINRQIRSKANERAVVVIDDRQIN